MTWSARPRPGTGKTAAFALPVLQRILAEGERTEPLALVLVPTRELAVQVSEAMHSYGHDMGARVLPVYGGEPIGRQLGALRRGVDVVVATPGRALDHINRGTLKLSGLEVLVLDEADEMFDMGFAEDIEEILGNTPGSRQTALFSATMPPRIDGMVRRHLRNPVRVELGRQTASAPAEDLLVRQTAYVVPRGHKPAALGRVLDLEAPTATVVFCRTRDEVDQLTETLNGRGYRAEALHGGMDQQHRDRVMSRLRSQTIDLLVATDVAARGLDIDQLTHVVNYDVPSAPESYVHRIGRVGRAGREGTAITLVEPREHRMLKTIERVTRQPITVEKLPTVADLRARRLGAECAPRSGRACSKTTTLIASVPLSSRLALSSTSSRWRSPRSGWPMRRAELRTKRKSFPRPSGPQTTAAAVARPTDATSGSPPGAASGAVVQPPRARHACSWGPDELPESGHRTLSAPSPASRPSPAGTSVRSRSPIVSPSWRYPSRPPTTWSRRSGRPASRAGGQPFAASAIRRGRTRRAKSPRLPGLTVNGVHGSVNIVLNK